MIITNFNDLSNEEIAMSDERENQNPNSQEKEVRFSFFFFVCYLFIDFDSVPSKLSPLQVTTLFRN